MSSRLKLFPRLVIWLCLLVSFPALLKAAGDVSISGTVRDVSGSSVPRADVSLYLSTTLLYRTQTGSDGQFSFSDLLPGTYVLECLKEGFQNQSLGEGLISKLPLLVSVLLALAVVLYLYQAFIGIYKS